MTERIGGMVVEERETTWILSLHGEHDLSTRTPLIHAIDAALAHAAKVVIDLSQTVFLDSSIIGVLYSGWQRSPEQANRSFAVAATPGSEARQIIDLVALAVVVPVYDDLQAALAALT